MTLQWDKVPSVRTGGKPYFYVAFPLVKDKRRKVTVAWDRNVKAWALTYDDYETTLIPFEIGTYPTAKDGMAIAERLLEDNSLHALAKGEIS